MSYVQRLRFLLPLFAAVLLIAPLFGQEPLRVGVALFPPNVVRADDGRLEGFDIELWQAIAQNAGLEYDLEVLPLSELLTAVEERRVDLALAGISVTSAREERMDFSHSSTWSQGYEFSPKRTTARSYCATRNRRGDRAPDARLPSWSVLS